MTLSADHAVPRTKNQIQTVQVTISTTATVVDLLQALVASGLYGKNQSEAAERLLSRTLEQMVHAGHIGSRTGRKE